MKKTTLLLVSILLLSCERIKEGTIIAKTYEPERHYIYMMPIVHSTGKTTYTTFIPIPMVDDEDYLIEIEGYTKKHKLQDRWIKISKEMYDTIRIKDYYCLDNMCHLENKDQQE